MVPGHINLINYCFAIFNTVINIRDIQIREEINCASYKYVNIAHYTGRKMEFFCLPAVFCDPPKHAKMRFQTGLRPRPRCMGSSRHSPDPLIGWGGDNPPQITPHSAPSALRSSRLRRSPLVPPAQAWCPRCFNAGYDLEAIDNNESRKKTKHNPHAMI